MCEFVKFSGPIKNFDELRYALKTSRLNEWGALGGTYWRLGSLIQYGNIKLCFATVEIK